MAHKQGNYNYQCGVGHDGDQNFYETGYQHINPQPGAVVNTSPSFQAPVNFGSGQTVNAPVGRDWTITGQANFGSGHQPVSNTLVQAPMATNGGYAAQIGGTYTNYFGNPGHGPRQ